MFEKIRRPGRSVRQGGLKKLISYIVFGLICLVFVFLIPMGSNIIGEGVLGYVGKEPIRAGEFQLILANIRNQLKSRLERAEEEELKQIEKEIRQKALNEIVQMYVLVQGAQKAGFQLSDKELRERIRQFPLFQQDGRFLYSRYKSFLKNQRLKPARFEERERKSQLAGNWVNLFKKALPDNRLEQQKKNQKGRYKTQWKYAELNIGDIEEEKLEAFVQAKDLKQINLFLEKSKVKWKDTGVFSLFSAFGIPIARNQSLMEAVISRLPEKGILPRLIRQDNKIYIVNIVSFEERGAVSQQERQLEDLLGRNFGKSLRLLSNWIDFHKEKTKIRLSDNI